MAGPDGARHLGVPGRGPVSPDRARRSRPARPSCWAEDAAPGQVEEVVDGVDVVPQRRQVTDDGDRTRRLVGGRRSQVRTSGRTRRPAGIAGRSGAVPVGGVARRARPQLGQRVGEVVGSQRRQVSADGHEHAAVRRGRGAEAPVQVSGVGRDQAAPARACSATSSSAVTTDGRGDHRASRAPPRGCRGRRRGRGHVVRWRAHRRAVTCPARTTSRARAPRTVSASPSILPRG